MRNFLCIAFIFLCLFNNNLADAQTQPPWRWVKRGGSMGTAGAADAVADKATDQYGNIYILANNRMAVADIDGHMGIGSKDRITLSSWDCGGNFRWLKTYGGGGYATTLKGLSLGTDSTGNVYVSGYVASTIATDSIYFDSDTLLTGSNMQRFFVIKYSTTGNLKWFSIPIEGPNMSDSKFFEMSVAPSGSFYQLAQLTSGTYGNSSFSIANRGFYVINYDSNGMYQAVTSLSMQTSKPLIGYPGTYFSFVRDHRNGRYYISGSYNAMYMGSQFSIGNTQIVTADTVNNLPLYAAAFSASGGNLWVKQGNSNINGRATVSPVDAKGNIYIGGLSHTGNTFFGHSIVNSSGWSSVNFIVAVDTNGNKIWGSNASLLPTCTYPSNEHDITCLNDTVAFVAMNNGQMQWGGLLQTITGQTAQGFLARFNATTGAIYTLDSITADDLSEPTAVVMDKKGNIFTAGQFRNTITLGNSSASIIDTILYATDWFVAKYGRNDTCKTREVTTVSNLRYDAPIVLFPNPATDVIYLQNQTENFSATIFNLTGARILQTTLSASQQKINITTLSPGIYILRLSGKTGKHFYSRFVKQ